MIGGFAILMLAIIVALGVGRDSMRRGWAMGIWIGIGVACLIVGLCFTGFLF